jgi:hypothetical protein
VTAPSPHEAAERTALLAQLEAACKREAEAREAFLASTAELRAENEQLRHRLANPCNGEDCESGGDGHCHRCAEAEADKLLAAVKRVRELVAWGVPIGPETLQRALGGEVLEAPDPLNLPTYAWGESVTWSNGCILVPLNLADATVADMELDEDGARTLADMLTDAARSRPPDCARCHDRGYVPDWSRGLDAEYGEPGKKPCPDCQGTTTQAQL